MARRLPRWHWIRCVMAHGPRVPIIRSVLFALSVRMDEAGEAFPAQRTIAADTASSERTVREAVLAARREGWLAVVEHIRPGQAWRLSHYVACVPDHLALADVNLGRDVDLEQMADQWQAQYGDILDPLHGSAARPGIDRAKARKPKGAAIASARSAQGRPGVDPVPPPEFPVQSTTKVRRCGRRAQEGADVDAEGADVDRKKVRTPSPTKFPSEVPIEVPTDEGRTLTRATARVSDEGRIRKPESEGSARKSRKNGHTIENGLKFISMRLKDHDCIGLSHALAEAQSLGYPITEQHATERFAKGTTA